MATTIAVKPRYNDPLYIKSTGLSSLKLLLDLINERRLEFQRTHRELEEFCLLGRFYLTSGGDLMTAKMYSSASRPEFLKDEFPGIPDVLTNDELTRYIGESRRSNLFITSDSTGNLPDRADMICPSCNKGWNIQNYHDSKLRNENKTIPLKEFVGMTLGCVEDAFRKRVDADYYMRDHSLIRNDKFTDHSPLYPGSVRKKNERGYVGKEEGITRDYVIQEGDEGYFDVYYYYHQDCHELTVAAETETSFRDVFNKAEFKYALFSHVPNQYRNSRTPPWLRVRTEIGIITIGWRSHVISIEWSNMINKDKKLLPLFSEESVTKEEGLIHAYGYEKAIEYLSKARKYLLA
jgi:hypothetical protein